VLSRGRRAPPPTPPRTRTPPKGRARSSSPNAARERSCQSEHRSKFRIRLGAFPVFVRWSMQVDRCSASGAIVAGPRFRTEASIICPVCKTPARVTAEELASGREIWRWMSTWSLPARRSQKPGCDQTSSSYAERYPKRKKRASGRSVRATDDVGVIPHLSPNGKCLCIHV
jgi:hypothetical protein